MTDPLRGVILRCALLRASKDEQQAASLTILRGSPKTARISSDNGEAVTRG
jgi:hypothetical protein